MTESKTMSQISGITFHCAYEKIACKKNNVREKGKKVKCIPKEHP